MRIFIKASQFDVDCIYLNSEQFHYLSRVLRIKKNEYLDVVVDELECFNIQFLMFKKDVLFFQNKLIKQVNIQVPYITLIQAIPKQDKLIDIIDGVTQIGVHDIYPVMTSRSVVKWDSSKSQKMQDRWQKRALQASMQSNRNTIPKVHHIQHFNDFLEMIDTSYYDICLVAWEESDVVSIQHILKSYKDVFRICLFIGPEGGIDQSDINNLLLKDFKIVSLGFNILRVEIAAIVAISQLLVTI